MRFGYWIKDIAPFGALTHARTLRLRLACPNVQDDPEQRWSAYAHPAGGTMMIYPALDGAAVPLEGFGAPRDTADGLVYYPPLVMPEPIDLIKSERRRGAGAWYQTDGGRELWIPRASATPRKIAIASAGGYKAMGWATEFAVLANDVFDSLDEISKNPGWDPRIPRLIRLALQRGYNLPDELLEDVEWMWDTDQGSILWLIFGHDPKALAGEQSGSASSAPTTPTSP